MELGEIRALKQQRWEEAQRNQIRDKASLVSRFLGVVERPGDCYAIATYCQDFFGMKIEYYYTLPSHMGFERVIFCGDDNGLVKNITLNEVLVYREIQTREGVELEAYRPGEWENRLNRLAEKAEKRRHKLRVELENKERLEEERQRNETVKKALLAFGPI